ncbi:MAG: aminodeoxychorismate/anthranilate synthase component II [Candidatus Peribacteraceae bacterium]|nr:aminodeoxychorismate/anthranilate synthase component II [Candidatus Peribacteraceae bacterium]
MFFVAAKKTLIVDNYDSFTFNLFQFLGELKANPVVFRNDELTLSKIREIQPTHIVISPGPGRPDDPDYFGVNAAVIQEMTDTPILGVCLGHQGICHAYGGKVIRAPKVMHGKTSEIIHNCKGLFRGIKSPLIGMRYHSLIAERKSIPRDFQITASEKKSNIVMAVEHRKRPLFGIQFHPESIGTPAGKKILANFLAY